jgi:thioredoxin reductase
MYDMVILGGGSAGLGAAMYALSKNLDVVVVVDDLGGKVGWHPIGPGMGQHPAAARHRAERDRPDLPADVLMRVLIEHTTVQPRRIVHDRAVFVDPGMNFFRVETAAHGVLEGRTVIVATGASPTPLAVPGAERFVQHGVGYSVRAYAQQVRDASVAVIGTTLRALRGAMELAHFAERVYLIVEQPDALDTPLGHALRQHPSVEVLLHTSVTELVGIDRLEEVVVNQAGYTRRLGACYAFADLGLKPNSQAVLGLGVTNNGVIMVDRNQTTAVPGLFAAGDVTSSTGEQALIAMGDGARAAMSAYDYLLAQGFAAAIIPTGSRSSTRTTDS